MKKGIISFIMVCMCLIFASPLTRIIFANNTDSSTKTNNNIVSSSTITQDQAKNLLMKYNNKLEYIYQGDASQFEALKAKNLEGYVFLPNVETDIGYFVDKNTSEIYLFHPSGYLELVK